MDVRAPSRFIDPRILARIDSLDLVARAVVDGFISGLHRAPFLGRSIDFAEHRAYMPGDDIRRIDWRVFARTDRFYVKEFEADTNANVMTVLDVSRSMDYGTIGLSKLEYGKFLAASLTYLSSRQRDRVGLITFDTDLVDIVPPSARHRDTVLHALDHREAGTGSAFDAPLRKVAERLDRRGIVVLISDFYADVRVAIEAFERLRYRGHDVIVFHLLDPAEVTLAIDGTTAVEDLETGERMAVIPERVRDDYQKRVRAHIASLAARCGEREIDYTFMDTSMPLDHALFSYLSRRNRLSRVR